MKLVKGNWYYIANIGYFRYIGKCKNKHMATIMFADGTYSKNYTCLTLSALAMDAQNNIKYEIETCQDVINKRISRIKFLTNLKSDILKNKRKNKSNKR